MTLIRRQFLQVAGMIIAAPAGSRLVFAQSTAGRPKRTEILTRDMEGQNQTVQETVVAIGEFEPGSAAPWHMHPSAQELAFVLEGNVVTEVEGRGTENVRLGQSYIIPAEVPHLVRNDSSSIAKVLTIHSRGAKDKPFVVVVKR